MIEHVVRALLGLTLFFVFEVNFEQVVLIVEHIGGDWSTTTITELFMVTHADMEAALRDMTVDGHQLVPLRRGALIRSLRALADVAGVEVPRLGAPMPTHAPTLQS